MTVLEQQLVDSIQDKVKELRREVRYWRELFYEEVERRKEAEQRAEESENKVTQ